MELPPSSTAPGRTRTEAAVKKALAKRAPPALRLSTARFANDVKVTAWGRAPLSVTVEPAALSPEPPRASRSPPTLTDAPGKDSAPRCHCRSPAVTRTLETKTPPGEEERKVPKELPASWRTRWGP